MYLNKKTFSSFTVSGNPLQWTCCVCTSTCNEPSGWIGYQYRYYCCWLRLHFLYCTRWHESCNLDRCLAVNLDAEVNLWPISYGYQNWNLYKLYIKSGFIVIIIVTSIDFGGYGNIFNMAVNGNRFPSQFEFDPRYRHTFWTVFIGNCTGAEMASFVCQEFFITRFRFLTLEVPIITLRQMVWKNEKNFAWAK